MRHILSASEGSRRRPAESRVVATGGGTIRGTVVPSTTADVVVLGPAEHLARRAAGAG